MLKSFIKISELTKQKSIPFLVVIFPVFYQLNSNYPFLKAHSMIKNLCDREETKALDLFNSYKGIVDKLLWVKNTMPINTHPNAKAHQIAALAIFREITRNPYFKIKNNSKYNK